MHLSCKFVFITAIASTFACHDAAAPPTLVAGYTLDNISGRPLPTFVSPIPEAPKITSAFLELDDSGGARLTEHQQPMAGGDVTYTSTYVYTITGNQIQFGYRQPCPPNANCVAPPKGTITESGVSLTMYGTGSGIVYNFRLVASN